ncbi:MAG: type II secretion system protein M [Pseudomonadota bacterium]|nr:type II secretion system protein M [Pseudomonadota bacterium]
MSQWWRSLNERDRGMLRVGISVVAALLFWAFLWDPADRSRQSLRTQVSDAESNLAYMHAAATQLQSLNAGGSASVFERSGRSLLALADSSAREARLGHAVKRIEPVSAGRVNIWLEAAEFDQVAIWLEQLQSVYGVRVEEYSLQRSEGEGKVDGRLSLIESEA